MNKSIVWIRCLLFVLCAISYAEGAQLVLIFRSGGISWRAQPAEKISFNDKDKLRLCSLGASELRPDEYKRSPQQPLLHSGLLRRHANGYFVVKNDGKWLPVAPDGINVKGPTTYASLWVSAKLIVQKDSNKKNAMTYPIADLFAVLPEGDPNEALAILLSDETNFRGVGEKDDDTAFEEWKSAVQALAPSVIGPSAAKIQQDLLAHMQTADQRLKSSLASNSDLQRGLQYAALARTLYPKDDRLGKAAAAIDESKAWRDRRIAILRAFSAAMMWDAFIEKYGDFERWDNSFSDLKKLREAAYLESTKQHLEQGKRFEQAKQFPQALIELRLAASRNPNDKEIKDMLEKVRLADATASSCTGRRSQTDTVTQRQVQMHLRTADNYSGDKQFADAENEINQAATLDPKSLAVLLARAKLERSRNQALKAIEILDRYDRLACDQAERDAGDALRSGIDYDFRKQRKELKDSMAKADAEADYLQASKNAEAGLVLDPSDLDFLLEAGLTRAIFRKNADAEQALNNYLRFSQAAGSDSPKRQEVLSLLPKVKETVREPDGAANWFSGYKSPPGVFYCPVSLMPNVRPASVQGSHKQDTSYDWTDTGLRSVHVTTQQQGERGFVAYFDYFKDGKGVRRVTTEEIKEPGISSAPRFTPKGPVGPGKGAYTALLNNPVADPLMIEKLTGNRVATIVAGNPYFHPFVWNGIYQFIVEYDNQGRIKSARQIPTADQSGRLHNFEFRWDGPLLLEIIEMGTGNYHRSMSYAAGKLIAETISSDGKNSKIEYKYKGDQMLAATCSDDPSIDGRSRHVTFH